MTMINHVKGMKVLNSRGEFTIEAEVQAGDSKARASAPSGASRGEHEAKTVSIDKATENIKKIEKELVGRDPEDQEGIDEAMKELDGTEDKSNLGGNTMIAVSMANARVASRVKREPLYKHLNQLSGGYKQETPVPFLNVLNGGQHAGNDLDFQEFMIVPQAETFHEAIDKAAHTYQELRDIIYKEHGRNAINVGDEGGFAPPISTPEEALELLEKGIEKAGYEGRMDIAVDSAATFFYSDEKYRFGDREVETPDFVDYMKKLTKEHPIISLEDPLREEDFDSHARLTTRANVQIVGDDIFVTNLKRLREGIKRGACNAILIKPNQVGTITETIETVKSAMKNKYATMVSHRSGDTVDPFIADLAVGLGCEQIKSGAPCRGERVSKYNRLLRIEEKGIPYAGKG